MVIPPERASWSVDPMAATASPRGKSQSHLLHSFSSPALTRYGNQRHLPCRRRRGEAVAGGRRSAGAPPSGHRTTPPRDPGTPSPEEGSGYDGRIEELRAKLLRHLREAADRMKIAATPSPEVEAETSPSAAETVFPWNLRARRAACKAPIGTVSPLGHPTATTTPPPPPAAEKGVPEREALLRSEDTGRQSERRRLSVPLSRDEVQEDIFAMTGSMPRRRPKKRAKIVQRQLDSLFPGLWLTEVTAELYKVAD